jgi:hypothetical protein
MTVNAAFADTGRGGNPSERLLYIRLYTIGDFLATVSYT